MRAWLCFLFFILSATEAKALIQSWKRLHGGGNDSNTAGGAGWTADKQTLKRMKRCPQAQWNAHRLNQVKTKAPGQPFHLSPVTAGTWNNWTPKTCKENLHTGPVHFFVHCFPLDLRFLEQGTFLFWKAASRFSANQCGRSKSSYLWR